MANLDGRTLPSGTACQYAVLYRNRHCCARPRGAVLSRRDDIITAAIRLAEQSPPGQTNLSVRAVAREAGIGASTLRHYFPT
ncbi:MAG: TetR/AcrR family transcriptional regulator, partial [Brevibacterium sp.]|nr:TetR/AcrR family transcriptional regulator [Brevibacterium sp.]